MDTLGKRLIAARRRRNISQQGLAGISGLSVWTIRDLEQGKRESARLGTITTLANALDIPISDLLGVQPGLHNQDPAGDVATIRQAIYTPDSDIEPPSIPDLRARVADLRGMYWHARFAVLAAHIPGHLAEARAAVRQAENGDQRDAQAVLARSLQLTASLLTHLAHEDLAQVALLQASEAAAAAEDKWLQAALQSTTAWVLTRQGFWSQAQHLATTAAREIEPVFSEATPEQIGTWGGLLHFGMAALAREGRDDEAYELLSLVQVAGQALEGREPNLLETPFNATWAAHSAVQLHKDLHQPRKALAAAQKVETPEKLAPSVRARFLLNLAWASSLEWKNREALNALKEIQQLTPELLSHHGLARAIVEELLPRRRKERLPGLIGLAEQVGIVE